MNKKAFPLLFLFALTLLACSGDPQQKAHRLAQKALDVQLKGNYQDAANLLEQAIRLDPEYPEAYVGLGQMYSFLEKHKEAKECYEKAIKEYEKRILDNPGDADSEINDRVNQAGVYAILLRFGTTRDLLGKVLEKDPGNQRADYFLNNMKEFSAAWNQFPPPHPSEQKIQREMLAPLE